jgi:hypothetical protein
MDADYWLIIHIGDGGELPQGTGRLQRPTSILNSLSLHTWLEDAAYDVDMLW